MARALVLTAIGADRPGLVDLLASVVAEHGGNWESSRMARLGGKFAGIAEVTFGAGVPDGLLAALRGLESQGLTVTVEDTDDVATPPETALFNLELVGNDHPGILHSITRVLAAHEVNVEELGTACESAAMAGGELFRLRALLAAPPGVDLVRLEGELEELSGELMVEISLAAED